MEYAYHLLSAIIFIVLGWKMRNSKVDESTLMPGYSLEGVMRKRKVCGNIILVMGGIYLIITLVVGILLL